MKLYEFIKLEDDKDLFIIGDLHGCYDLYKKGERVLGIRDTDYVISLGDLTDRGKQNLRCVIEFTRKSNHFAIRGNHEDMLIKGMLEGNRDYYQCWYQNGGHTVWGELGEDGVSLLATMVENLPVVLVVEHRGKKLAFIHGGYPSAYEYLPVTEIPNLGLSKEKENIFAESLMWDRDMISCAQEGISLPKVLGVDYVFHGHSYVPEPLINANRVYMDTGSCFNNNLTFSWFDEQGTVKFYSTLEED
ncbi:NinI-like serine-threonine phosphatase [Klebsiella phage phi1_175008]|uniref:NinI-like serine-threonine phosphatase n=2 Tax=Klebsiella phage phi1_175008 TaxID=3127744 RepID=A0ACD5FRD9_9CAUD